MKPGTYIKKRREAAGLSLGEVARQLAAMQFGIVRLDRANLLAELEHIEADEAGLTLAQAQVLRNVFSLDVGVYDQLLDRHLAAKDAREALPLPQICRGCGCSFFDACVPTTLDEACHWAAPDLCSACADNPAAVVVESVPVTPAHQGAC